MRTHAGENLRAKVDDRCEPAADSSLMKHLLALLALAGLAASHAGAEPDAAAAVADRMLATIGGRAAWAALENTVNVSQQNRATEPTVVEATITMDFRKPRFRIETIAPNRRYLRVIDGERNWQLTREGEIVDQRPDLVEEDLRWYGAHLYRTLHRIAAKDPALTLTLDADGDLEVHEGGARLAWLRLDARGEPYRFGQYENEEGSLLGPWDFVVDGIPHPSWVSNADGTWRAKVKTLRVNVVLGAGVFERPGR